MSFPKGFRNALIPSFVLWGLLGWGIHSALGQSVQQSGSVTPNTAAMWSGTGIIKGGNTATDSPLTTFGVTRDGVDAICISSARATAAGRNQLCFQTSANDSAKISLQNYGTATPQGIQFIINGVAQGLPTVTSLPVVASDYVCFSTTTGTLRDCGWVQAVGATNQIPFWISATALSNITAANNAVLVTSGTGAPSLSPTLPNGIDIGTPAAGTLTNVVGLPISTGLVGAGIGTLTALATNVGTAGSIVVNGGALGSPSSVGTLPALTLGGTISGGGNQLNNVVINNSTIGATTPLAGFFTTLSASSNITTPVIAPVSDGTTAFRINNFAQTHNIVTVDTTNFRVGINKNPGAFDLDVNGAVNFSSTLAVTGHVTLEGVTSTAATGTGALVFGTAPTITLANGTGLPIATGVSGLGTGVATALAVNTGSAGAFVIFNGALGTPSSGTLTSATGLPISTGLTGAGTGVLTALGVNIGTAGSVVVNGGALGSPSSVGTLPAHTLGGTISGGGNQINNVIIGTTTPLAGLFTTLSASTSLTSPLHIGGTTTTSTATIQSTSGAGTTGADIVFKTGNNGATEDARILNSGFFGIGSNSPQSKLHVNLNTATQNVAPVVGTTAIQLTGLDGSAAYFELNAFGANPQINLTRANGTAASRTAVQNNENLFLLNGVGFDGTAYGSLDGAIAVKAAQNFAVGSHGTYVSIFTTVNTGALAESARFQNSGGVSIGTSTDPGIGSLQINANIFAPNLPTTTAALGAALCWTTTTGQFQRDTNAGGCLVSSERYKHNIKPISDGLSTVMASRPVTFTYNDTVGIKGEQIGFIAEQMATVNENLIGRLDDGTINSVRYMQYTAVLASAIQQLKAENDNLSQRLTQLENIQLKKP